MGTGEPSPRVFSFPTRKELGRYAAAHAASTLKDVLRRRSRARLMLAAAPSQEATLDALRAETDLDWSRVDCFHMDEYVGLSPTAQQGFGNWLQAHFLDHLPLAVFHRITPTDQPDHERARYARLMGSAPFDVVLLGLGVNGHLAFNDPPADFADPQSVRVVTLDRISRQQQVDEGHFVALDQVPTRAITVTIPRLLNSVIIIASVPGRSKRQAVAETLSQPIHGNYPGTALRTHPHACLLLDTESDPGEALGVAETSWAERPTQDMPARSSPPRAAVGLAVDGRYPHRM